MKKKLLPSVTLEVEIPDYNREVFTDMLIAGENIVPWTNRQLLIDEEFFYSHEHDVEKALREKFTPQWRKRKYADAVREAEDWRKYFLEEEKLDEVPAGLDANSIFKRLCKIEMHRVRISANKDIAHCWVRLLKHRPEYVDRCPWRFFQGDRIWQTLQDEEFLNSIKRTPLQVAEKMDLNAMSLADWDEVVKIVPEMASRRPKNDYICMVE